MKRIERIRLSGTRITHLPVYAFTRLPIYPVPIYPVPIQIS